MQSLSVKEKKLKHVRALLAKAKDEAASEEEAKSALAKAQELIDKYDLSEEELTVSNEEIVTGFFTSYVDVKNDANSYINREWLNDVANTIAKANFCKIVIHFTSKEVNEEKKYMHNIQFIGREDKLTLSMELFDFYWRKILSLCKEAYKLSKFRQTTLGGLRLKVVTDYKWVDPAVFYRSYIDGALDGLKEMYVAKNIEAHNKNPEYGLMVINHKKAVNVYIEQNIGKLVSHTTIREHKKNASAYQQGKEDVKSKTRKRLRS